jgi:hypothetical protein
MKLCSAKAILDAHFKKHESCAHYAKNARIERENGQISGIGELNNYMITEQEKKFK